LSRQYNLGPAGQQKQPPRDTAVRFFVK